MSTTFRFRLPAALALGALLAAWGVPAEAHLLNAGGAGAAQGFAHPFSGLDHILAMVAVGLWAAQIGRRALWVLPLAFPLAMAAGGLLGMGGIAVPGVETGIGASVMLLGLLIALVARPPLALATVLVVLFAIFHGHAHGTELPQAASPVLYGLGLRRGDGAPAHDRHRHRPTAEAAARPGRGSRGRRLHCRGRRFSAAGVVGFR